MPRPRAFRRVGFNPSVTHFKPAGTPLRSMSEVVLGTDELEALRLKDFLGKEQNQASVEMGISQPTFHRLLLSARKKVADALVNGKAIRVENREFVIPFRGGFGRRW